MVKKKFEGKEEKTIERIKKWSEKGKNITEMSKKLGCCHDTLSRFMEENDLKKIKKKMKREVIKSKKDKRLGKLYDDEGLSEKLIREFYEKGKMSQKATASMLDTSMPTLRRFMDTHGIHVRNASEAQKELKKLEKAIPKGFALMEKDTKVTCVICGKEYLVRKNSARRAKYCPECKSEGKVKYYQKKLRNPTYKLFETEFFSVKGEKITCKQCNTTFRLWKTYVNHRCEGEKEEYLIEDYVKKARRIYQQSKNQENEGESEPLEMDKFSCKTLNCKPTIDYFNSHVDNLPSWVNISPIEKDQIIHEIKRFVKFKGVGRPLHHRKIASALTYVILKKNRGIDGKYPTQAFTSLAFKVSEVTLRTGMMEYKTALKEMAEHNEKMIEKLEKQKRGKK